MSFDERHEFVPIIDWPPIQYIPPAPGYYDNGYVFPETPHDPGQGSETTSDFGYDDSSQLGDGTLSFTLPVRSLRYQRLAEDYNLLRPYRDEADATIAPYLAISRDWITCEGTRAGFTLSLSTMNIEGGRHGAATVRRMDQTDHYQTTVTHVYDTGDAIMPPAPYRGGAGLAAPRIPDKPSAIFSSEPVLTGFDTRAIEDSLDQDLEVDLHSIALGGYLEHDISPCCGIRAAAGMVLNFADWECRSSHVATVAENGGPAAVYWRSNHRDAGHELLAGCYLEMAMLWRINTRWGLECATRYDWNQSLDGRIGGGGFHVGLDGWSVGLGVSCRY